jgi:hypothetical protein
MLTEIAGRDPGNGAHPLAKHGTRILASCFRGGGQLGWETLDEINGKEVLSRPCIPPIFCGVSGETKSANIDFLGVSSKQCVPTAEAMKRFLPAYPNLQLTLRKV